MGDSAEAAAVRMQALRALGQVDEAWALLRGAQAAWPDDPVVLLAQGDLEQSAGDLEAARRSFMTVAGKAPALPGPPFRLAHLALQQGDATEALTWARRVTDLLPEHAEAWDLRAQAAAAAGDPEADDAWGHVVRLRPARGLNGRARYRFGRGNIKGALADFEALVALVPDDGEAWTNLGVVLRRMSRHEEACAAHARAVAESPELANAWSNYGVSLRETGQTEQAAEAFDQAIALNPDDPDALNNRALLRAQRGQPEAALEDYRQAVALAPDRAVIQVNMVSALVTVGRFQEAVALGHNVVARAPTLSFAWNNLGLAYMRQGQLQAAEATLTQAAKLAPDSRDIGNNLGNLYATLHRLDDALAVFERLEALYPEDAEVLANKANVHTRRAEGEEAEALFRRAVDLAPDNARVLTGYAMLQRDKQNIGLAAQWARKATIVDPNHAAAWNVLAVALSDLGKQEESDAAYAHALAVPDPAAAIIGSNRLFSRHYSEVVTRAETYRLHQAWAARHGFLPEDETIPHANARNPERILTVGYVSPDFKIHPVPCFLRGVFAAHDRKAVRVVAFDAWGKPDEVTEEFRGLVDAFHPIATLSDVEAAALIRREGVDVLVDLAGHSSTNRLPLFALRPAPVQVSWLGYPDTTGLDTFDARITDAIADPPGDSEAYTTEPLVRLAHGAWCYTPAAVTPMPKRAPRHENGFVTFGSFNNLAKVEPSVRRAWAMILKHVPGAKLLIKARQLKDDKVRRAVLDSFVAEGIDAGRLILRSYIPEAATHMDAYGLVDVALDPFPYNGTTTTCDALWMGVPVVTLRGDRHCARVGASLLHRVGLDDVIAKDIESYVSVAATLAQDGTRLDHWRESLRAAMCAVPLGSPAQFTPMLEDVYRTLWRSWCVGPATYTRKPRDG